MGVDLNEARRRRPVLDEAQARFYGRWCTASVNCLLIYKKQINM